MKMACRRQFSFGPLFVRCRGKRRHGLLLPFDFGYEPWQTPSQLLILHARWV